jgi:hypothetical protein
LGFGKANSDLPHAVRHRTDLCHWDQPVGIQIFGALVKILHVWLLTMATVALALAAPALAQNTDTPAGQPGSIVGTALDANDNTLSGATVVLQGLAPGDRRTVVTNDNGFYELHGLKPGIPYHVVISAKGFAGWTSPVIVLEPGQYKILTGSKLRLEEVTTTVAVNYSSEEVATQQLETELKQRVFGFIPNFYTVYEPNPEPLTANLKFRLALKEISDPVNGALVAVLSGAQQAADTPDYGQGAKGFSKRFGANSADAISDIMIGSAILPTLLHQDPRYFYQGNGTNKSRLLHALSYPFLCKGDNGNWQPNYSSMGGALASAAISNAYYPESNRGAGLVFGNFAITLAGRMASGVLNEFVLRKFTHNAR